MCGVGVGVFFGVWDCEDREEEDSRSDGELEDDVFERPEWGPGFVRGDGVGGVSALESEVSEEMTECCPVVVCVPDEDWEESDAGDDEGEDEPFDAEFVWLDKESGEEGAWDEEENGVFEDESQRDHESETDPCFGLVVQEGAGCEIGGPCPAGGVGGVDGHDHAGDC